MEIDRIHLPVGEEIGGHAGATIALTPSVDKVRVSLPVPPTKVIPIIFLPGVMGTNLRMSRQRQAFLNQKDNKAWRPDDLGPAGLFGGNTHQAQYLTPSQRQLMFDPDEVEVDRYEITEDAGKFDLTGEKTQDSDARHQDVPNGLPDIGLLMSAPLPPAAEQWKAKRGKHESTAAQKARWRGWSEVLFRSSYGDVIKLMEERLNNMVLPIFGGGAKINPLWSNENTNARVLGVNPSTWGGTGDALTEADILRIANCWYPVYAMGYNYLQSNGQSAKKIAKRVTDIIQMYKANGRQCEKVIIVTHSMGGLVTRALLHSEYGNIKDKILGVYHSVQPALGSAAAYKRVRTGFDAVSTLNVKGWVARNIMGKTGKEVTAVFANAPGPLELLPIASYPRGWLRVKAAHDDRLAMALPATSDEPLKAYHEEMRLHQSLGVKKPTPPAVIGEPVYDIYGRSPKEWWRLLNPEWINPAKKKYLGIAPYGAAQRRIALAQDFHTNIKNLYHPTTYASYGADTSQKTYGSVTWRADTSDLASHGDPLMWTFESEDAEGKIVVRTQGNRLLTLTLAPAEESGDQTVPAKASAEAVGGTHFRQTGYDHQKSYLDDKVLASLLYSIVKIANTSTWWDK
ncbi:hypothetical protein R16034_00376 [Ralstonia edaphis]|uniref:GPI inositol-deacylase PGAP1-like alpha/beta domain-containing protein n=1 Tax=Ralstonia edaphi TaxID=3058599 RepID=A0AB72X350_9RALS|nr:hypothetical protein [Ralstonia sp. LMG 6871]CAJ0736263.1 hypothetical protein R16034_00376 [Ralstonia sp. LMG 6871]